METVHDDDIERRVILVLAAALDRDPSEIAPAVGLQDLGAESLDFLDVAFRLEKELRIRMPRLNVLQRAEDHFGAGVLVKDGLVTHAGLDILGRTMPEVDPARLVPGLRAAELGTLLSANTFVRVVRRMLVAKRDLLTACPSCGGTLEESPTTREAICVGCQRVVPFPAGDDILLQDLIGRA
jgi:acyl carrier protein